MAVLSKGAFFLLNIVCFAGAVVLAVRQDWSIQEFCWSTWIAGLAFSLLCALSGYIHLLIRLERESAKLRAAAAIDFLPRPLVSWLVVLFAGSAAFVAASYVYLRIFAFYGLFLSVFAEMKPLNLFGRNGFINSDFFTPAFYLVEEFWPVILFASVSGAGALFGPDPWIKMVMPFKSREIARIHLMVLALPFLSMIFWMVFRENYHTPAVIALLAVFYLLSLPTKKRLKADG